MKFLVKAKPWSKNEKIEKIWKDLLSWLDIYEIKIKEKPIKWKANEAIINKISEFFKIPKHKVKLIKWNTSKLKLIEIEGL